MKNRRSRTTECPAGAKEGMTLAIEPMVNQGTYEVKILEDGWTAVTADGRKSAHFEHTILVTSGVPEILTKFNQKNYN